MRRFLCWLAASIGVCFFSSLHIHPVATAEEIEPDKLTASDYVFSNIVSYGDDLGYGDLTFVRQPAINNHGDVVFFAKTSSGNESIYTWRGGQLRRIVHNSPGSDFSSLGWAASINDSGLVAFTAETNSGDTGIFTTTDGSSVTTIADTSGSIDQLRLHYDSNLSNGVGPSLNNSGQVAFWAKSVRSGEDLSRRRIDHAGGRKRVGVQLRLVQPPRNQRRRSRGLLALAIHGLRRSSLLGWNRERDDCPVPH